MIYDHEEELQKRKRQNRKYKILNAKWKKYINYIVILMMGIGLGMTVMLFKERGTVDSSNLTRFDEVYQLIEKNWLNTTDNTNIDLEAMAIKGLLEELGDPHTMYFTPEQSQQFTASMHGGYAGIGVTYRKISQGCLITNVHGNGPASGIVKNGDIIVEVENQDITTMTSEEIASKVRGEAGTSVQLTLLRNNKREDVSVKREHMDATISYEIRQNDKQPFGYLNITTFGDTTAKTMEQALLYFKQNNISDIVIDLRSNTGGYLVAVEEMLSYFLEKDELMFTIEQKSGPLKEYKSLYEDTYYFKTGYILVDGQTASASEVMAGCLQQKLGYEVVGCNTYGKGTAQTQFVLDDLSSFKYTYAKWNLPDGSNVNGVGVSPTIPVDTTHLYDFANLKLEHSISYDQVGQEVAYMQKMLNTMGYHCGREDGYFSTQTKQALETFEKEKQLKVNGILENEDITSLIENLIIYLQDEKNDACYQRVLEEMKK